MLSAASEKVYYPYNYNYSDNDAEQAGCVYDKDSEYNFSITWLVGHGDDGYAVEPAYFVTIHDHDLGVKNRVFKTPSYEISVNLTVKLKGVEAPFVFSRLYLPEIKNLDIQDLGSIIENAEKKNNLSPKTAGHTELYDMQLDRLKSINNDWNKGFNVDNYNDK